MTQETEHWLFHYQNKEWQGWKFSNNVNLSLTDQQKLKQRKAMDVLTHFHVSLSYMNHSSRVLYLLHSCAQYPATNKLIIHMHKASHWNFGYCMPCEKEKWGKLTGDLIPESGCIELWGLLWFEVWINGCSSNLLAVGLKLGFLLKQHLRKSFPSGDRLSGIGGSVRNTLNIAAGCSTTKIVHD